jgi:hypothetical protein
MPDMLEFLFGPRNPTRTWPPCREWSLVFSLDDASLNGVKVGEPLNRLTFLGPDEDRKGFRNNELSYFTKGLQIRFNDTTQRIVEFRVVSFDRWEPRFRAFDGAVVANGQNRNIARLTKEQFLEVYGESYWIDRDEDETILFYEFVSLEWQVEFDTASRFKCITVTAEPVLAREEQRLAYQVTKQWPPPGL